MPTKMLLVTEIDQAESVLIDAVGNMHRTAQKKITDQAQVILNRYRDKIAAAVGRVKNVRVINAAVIGEFTEFESRKSGVSITRTKSHYKTAFVVDADGDGKLADLWREDDRIGRVRDHHLREVHTQASRLRSDLRLVDRCREGDDLHRRIVAFVQQAREAKGDTK